MITYHQKVYLGDGVFFQRDSLDRVILTTEDGMSVTNMIIFEPEVLKAFQSHVAVCECGQPQSAAKRAIKE